MRHSPGASAVSGEAAPVIPGLPMSDQTPGPDGTQDTFISHLIELRSRLMRSIIAIVIVLLCLFPWAKNIYAFYKMQSCNM